MTHNDQPVLFEDRRALLVSLTEQRKDADDRWQRCYHNCQGAARALGYAEGAGHPPDHPEVQTRRDAWARYSDELDQIQAELRDLSRRIADLVT